MSVNYIICTTARSGSNLMCDVLRNTRRLGHPVEAFNPDFMRAAGYREHVAPDGTVAVAHFVAWIMQRHRTKNGAFGTKILFEDFETFRGFTPFSDLFFDSRLVHLRRRSKLKQAISYYLAEETGQWVATDKARKSLEDVRFDFEAISRHLDRLIVQDSAWTAILNGLGLEYMEVYFEDFLADMNGKLHEIASFVGVDTVPLDLRVTLTEQANPLSRAFMSQFREAFRQRQFATTGTAAYKGLSFH